MTILDLLQRIHQGGIALPAIQRDFAWAPRRIYRLLDSIMQGYPIGIVLIWETFSDIQYRPFASDVRIGQIKSPRFNHQKRKLGVVLDGQQRLQSLYSAVWGSYNGKSLYMDVLGGRESDDVSRERYDFKFMDDAEYQRRMREYQESVNKKASTTTKTVYYVKVADLLNFCFGEKTALRKFLVHDLNLSEKDEERIESNILRLDDSFSKNRNILKVSMIDEDLPSDAPHRKTEAEVLEIFVRVNREGTPLSRSDLTFSILKLTWKESAVTLPEFVAQINIGNFFNLDTDFVIRCLFAVSGLGTRFDPDLLRKPSMIERLRTNFPACCDAIRSTLDVVMRDCWISSSRLIGGQDTLLPFVFCLFHTPHHEVPTGEMDNFRKALYLFGFAKPFSFHGDNRLRKFVRRELEPLVHMGDYRFPFPAAVSWVKYWEGQPAFTTGMLQSNTLLTLHVLQGISGAKAQYWRNFEEVDHIFPRSELYRRDVEDTDVNHFANLWLLPKGRNINKSNRHPAEYFAEIDPAERAMALIDLELLDYSIYKTFLGKRGKKMLQAIKDRIGFTDQDFRAPAVSLTLKFLRNTIPKIPPSRASLSEIGPRRWAENEG